MMADTILSKNQPNYQIFLPKNLKRLVSTIQVKEIQHDQSQSNPAYIAQ
jgi:hypothetical protein